MTAHRKIVGSMGLLLGLSFPAGEISEKLSPAGADRGKNRLSRHQICLTIKSKIPFSSHRDNKTTPPYQTAW